MRVSRDDWAQIRGRFLEKIARQGVTLSLRDRTWAVTPEGDWIALPGTSDTPVADRWWLGCDPEKLRARSPIGIVLLCQARGGSVHAIPLPASTFHGLEQKLSRNERQIFFSVVRRGSRFLLQLRGGEELDVTERVDDISWISGAHGSIVAEEPPSSYRDATLEAPRDDVAAEMTRTARPRDQTPVRFFAVAKDGHLHPLDDAPLQPGAFYLVEARPAQAVPGNRSLRRILARGGPDDLPPDFAQQHDHYAHGASRR